MANPKTNTIKTECCGHEYETERTPAEMVHATTDCPGCGELLIFREFGHVINALKFHENLHDLSVEANPNAAFHWPRDGKNTASVEIG